jgi:hypothetical protein
MNCVRVALTITLSLLWACAASAAEGTLSLTPAVISLKGDFGQSTTQTLKLTNSTSRAFSFDLVAQDVIAQNGQRAFVAAGSSAGSIAATAVFKPSHVDVPAGGTAVVSVTVTVPPGTTQRALIAVFRGTDKILSDGRVPMTASLGTLLTFSLSDNVTMAAAPLNIRAQSSSANLGVTQFCSNDGSEPLEAKGVLAILDQKGQLVGKAPLTSRRLLPGEKADLGGDFAGELAAGSYQVFVTWDYEGRTLTQSGQVTVQ